jgi:NAD(P)-dependent dehydrogenase (short-subunit alcohol dehydrogenase family)
MIDQTAVVVGVGPGLGLALVKAFAKDGYTVFAAARKASALKDLSASSAGERVIPVDVDATNAAQIDDLFATAEKRAPLAVSIFNAGTFVRTNVVDTDPEVFERCWRVGCFGAFLVGRAAALLMIKRGAATMLFTGATASLRGGAGFVNLASPKFALRAVAQSMARELGPQGIHVAHVIIDGKSTRLATQICSASEALIHCLSPMRSHKPTLRCIASTAVLGHRNSICGRGWKSSSRRHATP